MDDRDQEEPRRARDMPLTGIQTGPNLAPKGFELHAGGITYTFEAGTSRQDAEKYVAEHPAAVIRREQPDAPIGNRAARRKAEALRRRGL